MAIDDEEALCLVPLHRVIEISIGDEYDSVELDDHHWFPCADGASKELTFAKFEDSIVEYVEE